jgi:hypothetical protein
VDFLPTQQANASVFFIFPHRTFFNSILCLPAFGTFAFAPTAQADPKGKIKRAKFPSRNYYF